MKRNLLIGLVLFVLCAPGCSWVKPSLRSLNIQRAAIRGTGDTGVSVALDALANKAEAEKVRVRTKDICLSVQLFLENGKVSELTIPEITKELEKLIPPAYHFLLEIAIAQIQGAVVDLDKIGADNIARINAACVGIIRGCDLYVMNDRPKTATELVATRDINPEPTSVDRFGCRLKWRMGVK